jgi:hypothetical protein
VPCYVEGTGRAFPKGAWLPRPRRVRLVIGKPRAYAEVEPCKASARAIGEDLRRAVLALAPLAPLAPLASSLPNEDTAVQVEGGLYDGRRSPTDCPERSAA